MRQIKSDPVKYYFYCTLIVVVSWSEDGRSRPKHVARHHLIFCNYCVLFDVCCVLTVRDILHKKDQEDQNLKLFRKIYLKTHILKIFVHVAVTTNFQAKYMDGDERDQQDQNLRLVRKMYLNNTHCKKICARSSYQKFQANYMDGDETDQEGSR